MSALANLAKLRKARQADIVKLSEIIHRTKFISDIRNVATPATYIAASKTKLEESGMTPDQLKDVIRSGMLTFLLHCEARIASSVGQGFYTIGPCGEELLAAASLNFRPTDAKALHYRHVSNSIIRSIMAGKSIDSIALDRARGYVCSTLDPVTGGKHCSVGGSKYDFLITSTLASQAPPAVGRALGIALAQRQLPPGKCLLPSDAVSYVSMGDGSVNNAHFLAALNMAKYASHRKMKCPVIFGISDNGKCISLKGHGYIDEFVKKSGIENFIADGTDVCDIYSKSKQAVDYSRTMYKPSMLLFKNLPRRFGHAATDRQSAYMTGEDIALEADKNPLMSACSLAINSGVMSSEELATLFESYISIVENAFNDASEEPKISTIESLVNYNSQPLATASSKNTTFDVRFPFVKVAAAASSSSSVGPKDAMRKHMTKVFDEILQDNKDVVYIGEDVEHGGYYLVTEGLAAKYPNRVRDFPPDETSIVGAGMGFSQLGLVPIVEIPYAKYLDCAADMFYEGVFMNWLSDGKQPNGMVVRLQGFDKGVFGGNFHTHNMLTIPPGLDVVVYSNGRDYARGMRYAIKQARNGRIVMSVDSTDLLNRRHLYEKDEILLNAYPDKTADDLTFDDIIVYGRHSDAFSFTAQSKTKKKCIAIVSYGNGVPTSMAAMDELCNKHGLSPDDIITIDCPYISSPPQQLRDLLTGKLLPNVAIAGVVFADVCKDGPGMPLASMAVKLQNEGHLSVKWRTVGAANTYNPLSRTITFLNSADIVNSVLSIKQKK